MQWKWGFWRACQIIDVRTTPVKEPGEPGKKFLMQSTGEPVKNPFEDRGQ
uniref:Uncharacterized protein n=1 Tax=uncultured Desulfobacterium sp. TaxID=201089 RepID=E1YGW0_9BACT|nr:unknown protein [uncultured Desulfobacterium sp.]